MYLWVFNRVQFQDCMNIVRKLTKLLLELKQYDATLCGVAHVGTEIALLLQFLQLRFTRQSVWETS
jgi:hypothetical protein